MSAWPLFWDWKQKLTKASCEAVVQQYFKSTTSSVGSVSVAGDDLVDLSARNTTVCWVPENDQISLLMFNFALLANSKAGWNFDIDGIEPLQLGEYSAGGHYGWHMDSLLFDDNPVTAARKLTVVLMLSDPADYEGGELLLRRENPLQVCDLQGTVCVFPSILQHCVTPVTRGVRYSLVGWCYGNRWR